MQPCPRERQTAVGGALSCKRLEAVIGHLLGENHLVCRVVELGPCPSSATDDLHSLTRSLLSILLRKLLMGIFDGHKSLDQQRCVVSQLAATQQNVLRTYAQCV